MFDLFRSISSDYETATNEKKEKSCDLSLLVDYYLRISNHFWEDILKIQNLILILKIKW